MTKSLRLWLTVSLFNLMIVAGIGIILRYKIAYSLPFIDQKHLLHGHSHFAFAGWITQALMALMVNDLSRFSQRNELHRYRFFLFANLFTAYGMLCSFPVQGYGMLSISFSTLSIFVSYAFAFRFWKDLDRLPQKPLAAMWYKAALLFNAISSLGAFSLAYMMSQHIAHQHWYLGAVYFFLHFQYNGWFFFAGMGLLYSAFRDHLPDTSALRRIFWLFALACVPAYFLSALWMPIPLVVFISVVVAAIFQVVGWTWLIYLLRQAKWKPLAHLPRISKYLFILASVALTAKLLLQLGSTIPALSQFAFGFRPIVIGYLHLVLLGVITIFLVGYIFSLDIIRVNSWIRSGCAIFVSGIILNELGLMTQGIAAMGYHSIPLVNEFLLGMALLMFTGIALVFSGTLKKRDPKN